MPEPIGFVARCFAPRLSLVWTALTACGFALSALSPSVVRTVPWLDSVSVDDRLLLGVLFGVPSLGVLVGASQWLVIRQYVPNATWWIAATMVGMSAWFDVLLFPIETAVAGYHSVLRDSLAGTLLGLSQWLVLHRKGGWAAIWPVATPIATILSSELYVYLVEPILWLANWVTPARLWGDGVVFVGFQASRGLVYGAVTGLTLRCALPASPDLHALRTTARDGLKGDGAIRTPSRRNHVWRRWICLTELGGIAAAAWVLGMWIVALAFESTGSDGLRRTLGAGFGVALALVQWRLLREYIPNSHAAWAWATAIGSAAAVDIGSMLSARVARLLASVNSWNSDLNLSGSLLQAGADAIPFGAIAGGILGGCQWIVLRKAGVRWGPWLGSCVVGSTFGAVGVALLPASPFGEYFPAIELGLWSLAFGVSTGIPLATALSRRMTPE